LHEISRWLGTEKRTAVRQIVEALLAAGADPNAMSYAGLTPLHQALSTEDKDLVLTLLNGGANPTVPNGRGQTPLHMVVSEGAVRNFAVELIPLLIAKGADINALGSAGDGGRRGASPLILIVDSTGSNATRDTPLIAALLQNKASLDVQNDAGDTVLHVAARRNNVDALKQLLAATDKSLPAALKLRNLKGQTPLGVALEAKRTEAAELLRAAGATE
jgi:ankyrin repeat protein